MPRSRMPPYGPNVPGSLPRRVLIRGSCAPAAGVLSCTHGRHPVRIPAAGRSDSHTGRNRAPGAVAVHGDRPPREPGPAQSQRDEGRRAPGLVRVDGLDHDLAVVRAPAGAGPGVGQAARLARAARDQLPAGGAGRVVPADAARLSRPAELPQPGQGSRSGGLLDRLGGHRRDRADLGRDRPPVPGQPVRRRRRGQRGRRGAPPAASTRCWATPNSTRARCGRPSSIPA